MKRRALRAVTAAITALAPILLMVVIAGQAHADTLICEKYGATTIAGGRYAVQNNNWGDDTRQCINVTSTGFTITEASHNKPQNGAPGSYPSVFAGCHYANCTSGSSLPMRVTDSRFSTIQTSVSMTYPSSAGVYDAAYDIWFDPTARTDGQNTGAELMIWLNHTGQVQPVGSRVGTVNLAGGTWDVWFGNIGWNVVSYVRTASTSSISFSVSTFYNDMLSRGYAQSSWYITSVQAGFEPWVGGTGLAVNNFSYSVGGGGGGDTTAPSAPGNLTATGVTSSQASLSWRASSDNVGVTGYDVYRNGSVVGTATGTTFTAAGLSPSTAYTFWVRARDAAGNVSSQSNTLTVNTPGGGGGSGACRVSYVKNEWSGGFTANVTVTNTGTAAVSNWTLAFTFPGTQRITNSWNATVTQSGAAVTARGNSTIQPGATANFGFQGTWTNSNPNPTSFTLNGATCTTA
ncbi:cellulose binding domain-containing protein [Sphaerisporangium sp. TRM90804]|uniref:GH12 family glycosyl hydrolase domain-containing protein n=1 Tax=Sphaerisporangium sp. TRM90804 TaxID=3031113 RepID=UPI00244B62CE|nr:cellulose binding domain-containing protein [Sphaerisporangium sp. TRM90804]MDH2427255.1 cellulose binding domain-containing protein [Sphaerisporangium sp. TRM90804]